MAIKLENKPNVTAPNATYPYGNIKDDDGSGNGTPLNQLVHADFHQFFARILALSGITINGLLENLTNGWQYAEALAAIIAQPTWLTALTYATGWTTLAGAPIGYRKTKNGTSVEFKGAIKKTSPLSGGDVITLPAGFRPSVTRTFPVAMVNAANPSYYAYTASIDTNGLITVYEAGVANGAGLTGTGPFNLFFDSIEFSL